ncbi:hypothetical protein J437_LFUL018394, partial [Ladona fulva]
MSTYKGYEGPKNNENGLIEVPLRPTRALTWGTPMEMLGQFDANVSVGQQFATAPLSAVDRDFPSLFGLPWMRYFRLDWPRLLPNPVHQVLAVPTAQPASSPSAAPAAPSVSVIARPAPPAKAPAAAASTARPPSTTSTSTRGTPTVEVAAMLEEYKGRYPHVFGDKFGLIKGFEVHLRLREGATPVIIGPRPIPIARSAPTKKALEKLCACKFLVPCSPGPWGTPIVGVPKTDDDIRICGDYALTLNPDLLLWGRTTPHDFLSVGHGSSLSSSGMSLESQELTKINTPFGSFKWLWMPFGIASGPGEFQEIIMTIRANIDNIFIYLEDIQIWGLTREAYRKTLEEVLARLEKHHVRLNVKKCKFLVSEVKYLGFLLDRFGSRPDPQRIEELRKVPLPQNQVELKSWIGMVTFFFKYASHLATISHPLNRLVKSAVWKWEDVEQKAYDTALSDIGNQILVPYSLKRYLRMTSDASPIGASCVLSHVTEDGREEPIAFGSKTFTDAEKNYPVHEREAAAMVFGLKKFSTFLEGRDKLRAYAAQRLRRSGLILGAHCYTIVRHRSEDIPHANYLSRHPCADDTPVESEIYLVMPTEENILVSAEEVASATSADPVLRRVRGYVQEGWPDQINDEELKPYHRRYLQLTVENGCVLWGVRVIVPTSLREKILTLLHETHPGVTRMTALARSYVWYPNLDADLEQLISSGLDPSFTAASCGWGGGGVIEAAVSLVSNEVNVNGKRRHVSSSHLSPRSPTATCIDVDPVARLFTPLVPTNKSE